MQVNWILYSFPKWQLFFSDKAGMTIPHDSGCQAWPLSTPQIKWDYGFFKQCSNYSPTIAYFPHYCTVCTLSQKNDRIGNYWMKCYFSNFRLLFNNAKYMMFCVVYRRRCFIMNYLILEKSLKLDQTHLVNAQKFSNTIIMFLVFLEFLNFHHCA